jgi:hypothetical protein
MLSIDQSQKEGKQLPVDAAMVSARHWFCACSLIHNRAPSGRWQETLSTGVDCMRVATTNNVTERQIQQMLDDFDRRGFATAEALMSKVFGVNAKGQLVHTLTSLEKALDRAKEKDAVPQAHRPGRAEKATALTGLASFLNGDAEVIDAANGKVLVTLATFGLVRFVIFGGDVEKLVMGDVFM